MGMFDNLTDKERIIKARELALKNTELTKQFMGCARDTAKSMPVVLEMADVQAHLLVCLTTDYTPDVFLDGETTADLAARYRRGNLEKN